MKIAITGASGQIGRDLVPRLAGAGHELVLTGRDAARLRELFPGHTVFANEDFTEAFADADALIHLAVCNTDAAASPADHEAVNVEFALRVAEAARAAGIRRFVNVGTVRAIRPSARDAYGRSKARAEQLLDALGDMEVIHLRLGAVHGLTHARSGRLAGLPTAMRRLLMTVLASLRPTTAADRALDAIVTAAETGTGPAFITDGQHGNRLYGGLRRAIDIVAAAGGLALLAPLMLVIALLIRFGDGAPALLRQTRVGQGQQPFTCYKFRTMAIGTPARPTHESSAVSVTPIGRILRPTKLDELPQFFNVLRGDVSLVGPRPCLPNQTELVAARAERGVFTVRPGMSGLAQVMGIDMRDPEQLAVVDAEYGALRCLMLDGWIALRTLALLWAAVSGRPGQSEP